MISNDLKWKQQVQHASNKANRALRNRFQYKDIELYRQLYLVFVRPLLEFAVPVWNPFLKGDIITLERVQRRASKIPPLQLRNLTCEQRRNKCSIQSLEE